MVWPVSLCSPQHFCDPQARAALEWTAATQARRVAEAEAAQCAAEESERMRKEAEEDRLRRKDDREREAAARRRRLGVERMAVKAVGTAMDSVLRVMQHNYAALVMQARPRGRCGVSGAYAGM